MTTTLTNLAHPAGYEFFRFLDGMGGRPFTVIQTGRVGGESYQDIVEVPADEAIKLHSGLVAIGYKPAAD